MYKNENGNENEEQCSFDTSSSSLLSKSRRLKDDIDAVNKYNNDRNTARVVANDLKGQAGKEIGKDANLMVAENAQNKISNEAGKEVGKELSKEAGKEVGEEIGKEAAKQAGKEMAKQAAKATAETATAATGVGAPVVAAEKAAEIGAAVGNEALSFITGSKNNHPFLILIILVLLPFILLYSALNIIIETGTFGSSDINYMAGQYDEYIGNGNSAFEWFFNLFDDNEAVGEYNNRQELCEGVEKTKKIFTKAFKTCKKMAKQDVENELKEHGDWDEELTMSSYESAAEALFEDINYAEMITLINQATDYNSEHLTYKDLKALFKDSMKNENLKYLYQIKIEPAYGEKTTTDPLTFKTTTETVLYGKVTLMHYDLESFYTFIDTDANAANAQFKAGSNIDELDEMESNLRFTAADYVDLGSNERTPWTYGLNDSDYTYSDESVDSYENTVSGLTGDYSDEQKALLDFALSKLGTDYSQGLRLTSGHYDCSSFVSAIYRETLGTTFGSYAPVAADICKYLEKSNKLVSTGYNSSNMQTGDIIFYSDGTSNGRYKNISHVAFYAGNGKIVDASFSRDQVVYRDVWGTNEIVSVCRPLA